jgi:hypothetical protein
MHRLKGFLSDAGGWGLTSVLAAFLFFGIAIWEHTHDKPITAFTLLALSVPLFWIGAYVAWHKKAVALERVQDQVPRIAQHGSRAKLELRFSQVEPYCFREIHSITHHRVGIYNRSSVSAENVEVFLTLISPRPLSLLFPADYPYRVRRESSPVVETSGCRINPAQEELFEFAKSYLSSGMGVVVDGMDTKNERGKNPIPFEKNEYWHLKYKVTCANADLESVVFIVRRMGDDIVVERI